MKAIGLLFLAFLYPGISSALDLSKMTPLECAYQSTQLDTVSGQTDCGKFKVCEGAVSCSFVDSDLLAKEYGGNLDGAKKAAEAWYRNEAIVQNSKWIWSEVSGRNPNFIKASSTASCLSQNGACPGARACLLDKGVSSVGNESASRDPDSANSGGAIK